MVDDGGAVSVATKVINVAANQAPHAVASATPLVATVGEDIDFSSLGSGDDDGVIASYAWDFGDGGPGSAQANPTRAYGAEGTYTATLTVTDDNGLSATDSVTVTVDANPHPVAVINTDVTSGQGPLTVAFDGTDSTDDGSVASYLWNFGGGQTSTDAETSFTFTTVGHAPRHPDRDRQRRRDRDGLGQHRGRCGAEPSAHRGGDEHVSQDRQGPARGVVLLGRLARQRRAGRSRPTNGRSATAGARPHPT